MVVSAMGGIKEGKEVDKHTNSQPLVLPADKYRREDVPGNEQQEKDIVQPWVAECIKDAQEYQPRCSDDGEDDGQPGQDLLRDGGVGYQPALMSQPSV